MNTVQASLIFRKQLITYLELDIRVHVHVCFSAGLLDRLACIQARLHALVIISCG